MPPVDRYVAETTFRVRYAETDAMGIVHHSNYIVFFELGRSHYARERGHSYAEIERSGFILVVSGVQVRYVKAAVYEDLITVKTWIAEMKSRRIVFAYEIVHAETSDLLVTGLTDHIGVDTAGKVKIIPDVWRKWSEG